MKKLIKIGGQFSGVGAFDQALKRLNIKYDNIYQAEWDKYARQTYLHNYEEPKYYVKDVYETPMEEITQKEGSLDLAMFSPPCQAFSLAGKRLGKDDKRGILFFNSHEFIQVNKPRYFIFENVKGLLSDDNGKTFSEWVNMLGGKSVNGDAVMFPYEESVPYHIYWKVLNAKHHGVPQNRERVFIVGIRDDSDNNFTFPKEEHLKKRLTDVLENEVDEKYFLSEKMINGMLNSNFNTRNDKLQQTEISSCLCANDYKEPKCIKVKSATSKGYEEAFEGDSINFSVPNSETRIGRVGKGVAQTLDTACNQGVMIGAFRGRNPNNPKDRTAGVQTEQMLEINEHGVSNALTIVQKDNVVIDRLWIVDYRADEGLRIRKDEISPCMTSSMRDSLEWSPKAGTRNPPLVGYNYKIRRLTPRECFRLMDFPDTFTWPVSDSQAYKQAGNLIVVNVLAKIISRLNLDMSKY